jgi:hypothetical protein
MNINFKDLEVKDIEGKIVTDNTVYKAVADILWKFAGNLDHVAIAMEINKGVSVDLSEKELREILTLLLGDKSNLFSYVKIQAKDFIEEAIKNQKKE